MISTATAIPELLDAFNHKYGTSKSKLNTCTICHMPEFSKEDSCGNCHSFLKYEKGKNLNQYGKDLRKNKNMSLDKAFSKIESLDSNKDGISNIAEIKNKTNPGEIRKKTN